MRCKSISGSVFLANRQQNLILYLGNSIVRFQNGYIKVAIELRVVQFWSEIILLQQALFYPWSQKYFTSFQIELALQARLVLKSDQIAFAFHRRLPVSRACRQFRVFLRFQPIEFSPALPASYTFSRAFSSHVYHFGFLLGG